MNNSFNPDLKTYSPALKQIFSFEKYHLVIIDETIIQKLGINDKSITFVEQEITNDGILMRIKSFSFPERRD